MRSQEEKTTEVADQVAHSVKRAKKIEVRREKKDPTGDNTGGRSGLAFRDVLLGRSEVHLSQNDEASCHSTRSLGQEEAMEMVDLTDNLCPKLIVTDEELVSLRAKWRGSLIIKVLGKPIGFMALRKRLLQLWQPKGDLTLIDLANEFYIVKFMLIEDREWALTGGPWLVQGHYLSMRDWVPDFNPKEAKIDRAAIWVRVPNLPMEYQSDVILGRIGYGLRKTLKIDCTTATTSRGNFAHIFVEIKLDAPLKPSVEVRRKVYTVEYEGLQTICFCCGRIGHRKELCHEEVLGREPKEPLKRMEDQRSCGRRDHRQKLKWYLRWPRAARLASVRG